MALYSRLGFHIFCDLVTQSMFFTSVFIKFVFSLCENHLQCITKCPCYFQFTKSQGRIWPILEGQTSAENREPSHWVRTKVHSAKQILCPAFARTQGFRTNTSAQQTHSDISFKNYHTMSSYWGFASVLWRIHRLLRLALRTIHHDAIHFLGKF